MRMGNIVNGSLVCEDLKYLPATHNEFPNLLLKKGDVLFNRTNSTELVGKTAVYKGIPNPSSFASYLIRVRLVDEYLPDLLAYYINSVFGRKWISNVVSQQVGQANVNGTKLQALLVPVPPFDEQRRIVAKIEELFTKLDAGVESLKAAKKQLKRYRQALLKAAVEGNLTKQWRKQHKDKLEPASNLLERILKERRAMWEADQFTKMRAQGKMPKDDKWKAKYQEPAAPEPRGLPELPINWKWVNVEQIAYKITDGTHSTPKYTPSGVPFISVNNISEKGVIDFSVTKYISFEEHQQLYRRCDPATGDVLLTKVGTVGLTAVVPQSPEFSLFVNTALIKPLQRFLSSHYISFAIREGFISNKYANLVGGSTQQFVGTGKIAILMIPLPPLSEQRKIVEELERRLSVADEIEAALDAELKRAERLRQSILKRAFEGKLVLQDPSDEPASVLLECAKAEKAQHEAETRPHRNGRRGNGADKQMEYVFPIQK